VRQPDAGLPQKPLPTGHRPWGQTAGEPRGADIGNLHQHPDGYTRQAQIQLDCGERIA